MSPDLKRPYYLRMSLTSTDCFHLGLSHPLSSDPWHCTSHLNPVDCLHNRRHCLHPLRCSALQQPILVSCLSFGGGTFPAPAVIFAQTFQIFHVRGDEAVRAGLLGFKLLPRGSCQPRSLLLLGLDSQFHHSNKRRSIPSAANSKKS